MTCLENSCQIEKIHGRGLCNKHYRRLQRAGLTPLKKEIRFCIVETCDRKYHSKSYCKKHYSQIQRHGEIQPERTKSEWSSIARSKRKRTSGWSWSDEARKKQSKKLCGRTLNSGRTHFKKGHKSWSKGLKDCWSKEHIDAIKKANTGRAAWNKGSRGLMPVPHNKIGEAITPAEKLERARFRQTTQRLIFERDDYTCQECNERGGKLQVHHLKKWSEFPELRFDPENCITLCMSCHYFETFKRKIPEGVIWGHNLSRRIAS